MEQNIPLDIKTETFSPEFSDDFDKAFREYANKLKVSGKKFCYKCFDTRDLEEEGYLFVCRDCSYMIDLLDHITKPKN